MPLQPLPPDDRGSKPLQHPAALGALAAAPFAGMIGQKPVIHDPMRGAKGQRFQTMQDLSRAARPGDILMTTKPRGSAFKGTITPLSGSEFYHAQPVVGRRGGLGTTVDTGQFYAHENLPKTQHLKGEAPEISKAMRGMYPDVALLRPKKPLTPGQQKKFVERALQRAYPDYAYGKAIESWLRDLFVPKLDALNKNRPPVACEGNICSTLPSQALYEASGRNVVPGKVPQDVFPTDFLRSENFELVGSKLRPKLYEKPEWFRKAMPYLTRGAAGAGLAGTAYAASEDPNMVGVPVGALGTSMGADTAARKLMADPERYRDVVPTSMDALQSTFMTHPELSTKQILGRYLTRRIPLLAAGGAAGYYSLDALRNKLRKDG